MLPFLFFCIKMKHFSNVRLYFSAERRGRNIRLESTLGVGNYSGPSTLQEVAFAQTEQDRKKRGATSGPSLSNYKSVSFITETA
jgi:hypothetical protein